MTCCNISQHIILNSNKQASGMVVSADNDAALASVAMDGTMKCVVRLRGAAGTRTLDISAVAQVQHGQVTFTVPDASQLSLLTPEMKGRDKTYYIGVSIDGLFTFDFTEKAVLQIK